MVSRSSERQYRPPPQDRVPAPSDRVKVRRDTKHRGRYDREFIDDVLDATPFCHLAYVRDGHPVVIPTLQARVGDNLYLHASSGSRIGLEAGTPWPISVSVTLIEGLVIARSGFNHSVNYRSVVVMGKAELVTDPDEKLRALDATIDRVLPGRSTEVRPATARELQATAVARLPLSQASAKARQGPPIDEPDDVGLPVWAGVIPMHMSYGEPQDAPDLPEGVVVPTSVTGLLD